MSIDLIRYDRIWLQEYIEHISHEERLARELYDALQTALYGTSEDKILSYKTALGHTRELIDSLAVTRHALEQYLEQVQEAAMHLRKKCLELEYQIFLSEQDRIFSGTYQKYVPEKLPKVSWIYSENRSNQNKKILFSE